MNLKLRELRTVTRKNYKSVINGIITSHVIRKDQVNENHNNEICVFCGSEINLTKEHVVPRWIFDKSTKAFFTTDVNGLSQTYNKTTVPACLRCNSDLLNTLEKYVQRVFASTDLKTGFFSNNEIENIIRWLEVIDYKFQVLNVRRKFITSNKGGFIPYLAGLPISILRPSINYSPNKAVAQIRRSLKRLTVKSKEQNANSLVAFRTSNPGFFFSHTMNEFIFLELPKYGIAIFYFYERVFDNVYDARDAAQEIIQKVY